MKGMLCYQCVHYMAGRMLTTVCVEFLTNYFIVGSFSPLPDFNFVPHLVCARKTHPSLCPVGNQMHMLSPRPFSFQRILEQMMPMFHVGFASVVYLL